MTNKTMGIVLRFAVTAAVLVSGGALASTAQAAPPVVRDTFSGSDSETFDDCGLPLEATTTFSGKVAIRPAPGDPAGQAFLLHQSVTYRSVITNPATGKWVVESGHSLFKELRGTLVEGNIYRFDAQEAGAPYTLSTSGGTVLLRDRGLVRIQGTFDTLGDGEPGGIQIGDDVLLKLAGPHPSMGADTCALALPHLT